MHKVRKQHHIAFLVMILMPWISANVLLGADAINKCGDNRISVTMRNRTIVDSFGVAETRIVVNLSAANDNWNKEVILDGTVDSITNVVLQDTMVVLVGNMINSYGDVILMVNPLKASVVRTELCIRPVLSPNERFVAYENWFPRMGMPESRVLGISVLDLSAPDSLPRQIFPLRDSTHSAEENVALEGRNVHWPVSPIAWSNDSRALCFVDRFSPWGEWNVPSKESLVIFDLQSWPTDLKDISIHIEPRDNIKNGHGVDYTKFNVEKIDWDAERRVRLSLYSEKYWVSDVLTFDMPESFLK